MKRKNKRSSVIWDMESNKFHQLVKSSETYSEVLKYFKIQYKGGNCQTLKERIKEEGIDDSHILNRPQNQNAASLARIPTHKLFTSDSQYKRSTVKRSIIRNSIIDHTICSICHMKNIWQGKELKLVLDHINGISNDHRIENMRFLCSNCNSQTDTFAGKKNKIIRICEICPNERKKGKQKCPTCLKIEREKRKEEKRKEVYLCSSCNKPKKRKESKKCVSCANRERSTGIKRKVANRPSKEELQQMIDTMTWVAIGKRYNVSDNAIRKWARSYGIL